MSLKNLNCFRGTNSFGSGPLEETKSTGEKVKEVVKEAAVKQKEEKKEKSVEEVRAEIAKKNTVKSKED